MPSLRIDFRALVFAQFEVSIRIYFFSCIMLKIWNVRRRPRIISLSTHRIAKTGLLETKDKFCSRWYEFLCSIQMVSKEIN